MTSSQVTIRQYRDVGKNPSRPYFAEFSVQDITDMPDDDLFVKAIRAENDKSRDQFLRTANLFDLFNVENDRDLALLNADEQYRTSYLFLDFENLQAAKQTVQRIETRLNRVIQNYESVTQNYLIPNPVDRQFPLSDSDLVSSLVDEYVEIADELFSKKRTKRKKEFAKSELENLRTSIPGNSSNLSAIIDELTSGPLQEFFNFDSDLISGFNVFIDKADQIISDLDSLSTAKACIGEEDVTDTQGEASNIKTTSSFLKKRVNNLTDSFFNNIEGPVSDLIEPIFKRLNNKIDTLDSEITTLDNEISNREQELADLRDQILEVDPTFDRQELRLEVFSTSFF